MADKNIDHYISPFINVKLWSHLAPDNQNFFLTKYCEVYYRIHA